MSKVTKVVKQVAKKIENDIAPDLMPSPKRPRDAGAAAGELAPRDERIVNRAQAFETRAQAITQQARAAGATRTDNDADLLGFTIPKRKGAARAILG